MKRRDPRDDFASKPALPVIVGDRPAVGLGRFVVARLAQIELHDGAATHLGIWVFARKTTHECLVNGSLVAADHLKRRLAAALGVWGRELSQELLDRPGHAANVGRARWQHRIPAGTAVLNSGTQR